MPTIDQHILIDAPPEVVWRTVTQPDLVAQWFAEEVDLQPEPGYEGSVTFRNPGRQPRTFNVTVQSVDPPRSYTYRWQHPHGQPAGSGNSTLVEFTLSPQGGGTRLRVVELGVAEMANWSREQKDEFTTEHAAGWGYFLARARELIATQAVQ